jgi:uncharacterized protein YecE (DUF72 family)
MQLHVGTSGFAYREWIGAFYPTGIRDREMLAWYARQLDAVEINNTFYRFPSAAGLAAWAAQVPAHFQFAIKVPQRITHIKRLRDVSEDVARLLDTASTLGARLGPLLFLLPSRMPLNLDALGDVLDLLPPAVRVAFEFRDAQWHCDAVYDVLAQHGCALCFDDATMPAPRATTDWGYVRLRREHYGNDALLAAAGQVLASPWREAYVFIKHEAPDSPLLAQKWSTLAEARQAG